MAQKINAQEIIQKEKEYVLSTYPRLPFVLTRGKGSFLFDSEGNQYLDFGAGIAVNALGHCDEEVVSAIQQQAQTLSHVSNLYYTALHVELRSLIGGVEIRRISINNRFSQPLGPIKAVNPAATTTVGKINGKVDKTFNKFFPRNVKRPNKYEAGMPISRVIKVDRNAW